MAPPPRARRWGRTARTRRSPPVALVARTRSQVSRSTSPADRSRPEVGPRRVVVEEVDPAEVTGRGPDRGVDGSGVRHVTAEAEHVVSLAGQLPGHGQGAVLVAVGDRHPGAEGAEVADRGPSDAAGRAGHQGDAAVQSGQRGAVLVPSGPAGHACTVLTVPAGRRTPARVGEAVRPGRPSAPWPPAATRRVTGGQQRLDRGGGDGPGEVVALAVDAAVAPELLQLVALLDPLGQRHQVEGAAELDQGVPRPPAVPGA